MTRVLKRFKRKLIAESIQIADDIYFLEQGSYHERKEKGYLKCLHGEEVTLHGFGYVRENGMWWVTHPTDMAKNPEYKGEPLVKVVPSMHYDADTIATILCAEHWSYM